MNRSGTARGAVEDGGRGWRPYGLLPCVAWGIVGGWLCGPGAGQVSAQAKVRDRTDPIVTLDTGGHSAPVRALIFTPDGRELISGGFDKVIGVWSFPDGRPARTRTIRPPIWRGMAGAIYFLALSPPHAQDVRQGLPHSGVSYVRRSSLTLRQPGRCGGDRIHR